MAGLFSLIGSPGAEHGPLLVSQVLFFLLAQSTSELALGPVHFAHVGWAFVDIFPESKPSPDENYFLTYSHPYSFEAEAHLTHGLRSKFPVCSMNSGYSSGWCEVSYGVELEAQEITCRAMGQADCIFVMAPPKTIGGFVREYKDKYGVT